jgi:hypothetical protein
MSVAALAAALAGLAAAGCDSQGAGPPEAQGRAAGEAQGPARGSGRDAPDGGPPTFAEVPLQPVPGGASALRDKYWAAYFAETIDGDRAAARAGYQDVLESAGPQDVEGAARAALRLAELSALEGLHAEALDLVARATALGADDPDLVAAADGLRLRLSAVTGDDVEIRGPAAGTPLAGASPEAAVRFAQAEELLVRYLALRVRPRLENFDEERGRKQSSLEAAVRAYLRVVETGEPVAVAAAQFRIASLYHDLALTTLAYEVPPELDDRHAHEQRADLRRDASKYFRLAGNAYAASLAAAPDDKAADLWHIAARAGGRSVEDILRQTR